MNASAKAVVVIAMIPSVIFAQVLQVPNTTQLTFAYGKIVGLYAIGLAATKVCRESSAYMDEAEITSQMYLKVNRAKLAQASSDLYVSLRHVGGERAVQEFGEYLPKMERAMLADAEKRVRQQMTDDQSCSRILGNVRSGETDLEVKAGNELAILDAGRRRALEELKR